MESTIAHGFENTENADVNKQIPFTSSTMNFSQEFTPVNQITTENYQVTNDAYQLQEHPEAIYSPVDTIQQVSYDNQSHQNTEVYYSTPEPHYQPPEYPQNSHVLPKNDNVSDVSTREYIEIANNQNSEVSSIGDVIQASTEANIPNVQPVENIDDTKKTVDQTVEGVLMEATQAEVQAKQDLTQVIPESIPVVQGEVEANPEETNIILEGTEAIHEKIIHEETQAVKEEIQVLQAQIHALKEESEPVHEETQAIIEETREVSEETGEVSEDTEAASKDTVAVSEDTVAVSEQTVDVSKEIGAVSEESRALSEEMQAACEEKQAANEEIQAANEEIQIINEESQLLDEATLQTAQREVEVPEFGVQLSQEKIQTTESDIIIVQEKTGNYTIHAEVDENVVEKCESKEEIETASNAPIEKLIILHENDESLHNESNTNEVQQLALQNEFYTVVEQAVEQQPAPEEHVHEMQIQEDQLQHEPGSSESVVISHEELPDMPADIPEDIKEEEREDNPQPIVQQSGERKRKTRKPVHDIPMHVLGHDISKPVDPVQNGRALPKPRLGVKVPYRNLTSQIVSKAELEEEILERSRQKALAANKSDKTFARTLTQRLANKIAPETKKVRLIKTEVDKHEEATVKQQQQTVASERSVTVPTTFSKIENDDDLIAILEGDGEDMAVLPKGQADVKPDDGSLKLLEREIALQQLQELPHLEPKERVLKLKSKTNTPQPELPKFRNDKNIEIVRLPKTSPVTTPKKAPQPSLPAAKSNTSPVKKPSAQDIDLQSPISKKQVEVEPQVKANMVLKTYSRKRRISEVPEFNFPSPPKRPALEETDIDLTEKADPLALPTDVYVTKSSRVIKKKVIWDPDDEQTLRTTKSYTTKSGESSKQPMKVTKTATDKMEKDKKVSEKVDKDKKSNEKIEKDKKPSEKVENSKVESKVTAKSAEKQTDKGTAKKVIKKSPVLKPKRGLSEVDKLLMDEGAVKMLYDLKKDETVSSKKKKTVYSVEKAEKDILKKANLLKSDLVQNTTNESPKFLRKKDNTTLTPPNKTSPNPNPVMERKMSKDSNISSVHTPPRSPSYQFTSQSSMLVRRRSSSSLSSDEMEIDTENIGKPLKKSETSKYKKQKKNLTSDVKESSEKESVKDVPKTVKGVQYKAFTMKKSGKHVSIDLNYIDSKCFFTAQVLEELISALNKLKKDKDCILVSLTSSGSLFSSGLDYKSLVASESNVRIEKATKLAGLVREFLLCLLHFPKILVAGIQGECVGLGVTMLPLFDMVIASDDATFKTPYAELGTLGEGTFFLTYPNVNNNGLAAELLYACQTLKAEEVFRRGLISKLCWPEKYKDTLKNLLSSIARGSRQSLETTKRQLRVSMQDDIEAALDTEMDILIEHWTSSECQESFSKISE